MTQFLAYDDLSWPEVAELPRNLPLILPLGDGYPQNWVMDHIGYPEKAAFLPAIPFGWPGSALPAEGSTFTRMLERLLDGLREDGFADLHVLQPAGTPLPVSAHVHVMANQDDHEAIPGLSARGRVVIIPIGHTEQHGHHLPLSTDTLIIEAIAKGVAQVVPEQAVTLPVMPYGVSMHRTSFPGTLNCGGREFEDFWLSIVDSLVAQGHDRFYFLSGHGGNVSFLVNVIKFAGERHRRAFTATSGLYLSGPNGVTALESRRRSVLGGMGHACELETALLLHLRPDLVHMDRVQDETDFVATPAYFMDWIEGGALIANPPWDDDTITGAYGAGSLATVENGQFWLQAAIDEKVEHIAEIHTQYNRREQRRQAGFGLWGKPKKSDQASR